MSDLTVLYYTANRINDLFAEETRKQLLEQLARHAWTSIPHLFPPIVSVSQRPIPFGHNICIGKVGASIYQCYQQVLTAAHAARTRFVACCEDDTLYTSDQFAFRPPRDDTFYYNQHRWVLSRRLSGNGRRREAFFYYRRRTQMAMLVCARDLLVDTLMERFTKWPQPISDDEAKRAAWGEPGRYERNMGLTRRARAYFETREPCVTINHSASLMGRRAIQPTDQIVTDLPPWGQADTLWTRICR